VSRARVAEHTEGPPSAMTRIGPLYSLIDLHPALRTTRVSATLAVEARYSSSYSRATFRVATRSRSVSSGTHGAVRPANRTAHAVTGATPLRTPATCEQCRWYGAELMPTLAPYAKRYPDSERLQRAGSQVARTCHLPACAKLPCCRHERMRFCRPWRRWEPQTVSRSAGTGPASKRAPAEAATGTGAAVTARTTRMRGRGFGLRCGPFGYRVIRAGWPMRHPSILPTHNWRWRMQRRPG
jgi:hypothetical protein